MRSLRSTARYKAEVPAMIINPLPSPSARSAKYHHNLSQLLEQQRHTRRELDILRADKLDEYRYRINIAFVVLLSVFVATLFIAPLSWPTCLTWCLMAAPCVGYFFLQCMHYGDQLAETFDSLTPAQADWIARMSERDEDFQRILATWTSTGNPLIQRDYHALRALEVLASITFSNDYCTEA